MSGLADPSVLKDFNNRLQEALQRARGAVQAAKGPPSSAGAPPVAPSSPSPPTASGGPPREDLFRARLMKLRQEPQHPGAQATGGPAARTGPVGTGDYLVRPGDCLSSIAYEHGFFWETLWNDPANAQLRQVRTDPYVLLPGDRVAILEKRRKDEDLAPEKRHTFKRKGAPETLVMTFRTGGEPRVNQPYELHIDGELAATGVTDPNGRVEVSIPPDAMEGRIRFPESGDEYMLELGHLDPITEISGVQGRLLNLGFYQGPLDGRPSEDLTSAVRSFQRSMVLEMHGELDADTRTRLQEVHGS
jgi:hypothetical protein